MSKAKSKAKIKAKPKTKTKLKAKVKSKAKLKAASKTKSTNKVKSTKAKSSELSMVNKKSPNFNVQDSQGKTVSLSDFKGKKVVLYFYPKDDTPGCTIEGIEFNKLVNEYEKNNTVVFGVSKDSVSSHDKFKCKYHFNFELLADETEDMCKSFDVIKEKNMYGRKYMGIERSTFVIDENQMIIAEYRKVKPEGHATEILNFIQSLKS